MRALIVLFLLISVHSAFSQSYQPVVKSDTSVWFFAHKQLSGIYLDTLFAGQETTDGIEIWYKGTFYNHEEVFVGTIRSSENFDKLWFIPSEDSIEHLIYDISLEIGDEYHFEWSPLL